MTESATSAKKQSSMATFISTPKKQTSATEGEKITQAIVDMIVKDYVPLSIVEGEGFRHLLELLAPDFKIPARNTVRARIVKRYDLDPSCLNNHLSRE